MQQLKQFADVEFRAKDLIIQLKNEGYTGFQIQIIGTQLWDTGAIMAFDAARFGTIPPLPRSPGYTPPCTPVTQPQPTTAVRSQEPIQPAAAPAGEIKAPPTAPVIPASAPAPVTPTTSNPDETVFTCQKCYGTVTVNDKKMSMLLFNKTLCRTCNDKERIKITKDREAQVKGVGKQ